MFHTEYAVLTVNTELYIRLHISRCYKPCGGGVEYLHCSPASRRRRKRTKCLKVQGPGPPGWGCLESGTVKYGRESRGSRTRVCADEDQKQL
jgi:hypothetical protein